MQCQYVRNHISPSIVTRSSTLPFPHLICVSAQSYCQAATPSVNGDPKASKLMHALTFLPGTSLSRMLGSAAKTCQGPVVATRIIDRQHFNLQLRMLFKVKRSDTQTVACGKSRMHEQCKSLLPARTSHSPPQENPKTKRKSNIPAPSPPSTGQANQSPP